MNIKPVFNSNGNFRYKTANGYQYAKTYLEAIKQQENDSYTTN